MQLTVERVFKFGQHQLSTSLLSNLLNSGSNAQYADGANQLYSPLYESSYKKLSAGAFQMMIVDRF